MATGSVGVRRVRAVASARAEGRDSEWGRGQSAHKRAEERRGMAGAPVAVADGASVADGAPVAVADGAPVAVADGALVAVVNGAWPRARAHLQV